MKIKLLLILLIVVYQTSFSQTVEKFIDNTIEVNKNNIPIHKGQTYFPIEMFHDNVMKNVQIDGLRYDTFVVNWYSKHLFALKEPLLFNILLKKETYRFTWLRTFNNPIAIRIEKNKNECRVFWKVSNGAGGYEPGKLKINKSKKVNINQWNEFKKLLETCNFWNLELGRNSSGFDGSEWILEGNDLVKYRVVTDWSPNDGAYFDACNYLIELTNLKLKAKEKY